MNKRQKEVAQTSLDAEKKIFKQIQDVYKQALKDIGDRIKILQADDLQSKIYQLEYQKALKKQIENILDVMNDKNYTNISEFLKDSYNTGFLGSMYDIAGQGIPLVVPIDQTQMVKAIINDSKISEGLYTKMGKDVNDLKKRINAEVSRGIATSLPYSDIARNLNNVANIGINKAKRIAQTEGHRITQAATYDAQVEAKNAGADVVKQWDATLDGKTRETHRQLDGQIREIDEPFEVAGMKAMYPSDFGDPAEDCNCRCVCLQRARWALDEDELAELEDRASFFGLDKTDSFEDYKSKYLGEMEDIDKLNNSDIIFSGGRIINPNDKKAVKEFATPYYEEIRHFSTDVSKIAANLDIPEKTIGDIKQYLFFNDSFDPDVAIAQSWQRLMLGKDIKKHDYTLIKHEMYEMELKKKNPSLTHEEAHELASKKHNYAKEVDEYYGNLNKSKKRK